MPIAAAGAAAGLAPEAGRARGAVPRLRLEAGHLRRGLLPLIDERELADRRRPRRRLHHLGRLRLHARRVTARRRRPSSTSGFGQIVVAAQNQDNREHDIFDSDDYFQFHGGMIATIRALTGENPRQYFGDSADPSASACATSPTRPRRVFRSRVVNPKLARRHQAARLQGAFELAATVDYLFGYDATAQVIDDWMYRARDARPTCFDRGAAGLPAGEEPLGAAVDGRAPAGGGGARPVGAARGGNARTV